MEISVNGEQRSVDAALSVAELLRGMGLEGKRLAVERNGEIVPKSNHAATPLAEGDRIEIVIAVGGG
jgi:sulfur carrier protein